MLSITHQKHSQRIPALDGLRAISVSMVIVCHAMRLPSIKLPDRLGAAFVCGGNLGVRFFFVISGFIISKLLLTEIESHGKVDLRKFYFRRTFRILPAYYVFLCCVVVMSSLRIWGIETGNLIPPLSFTSNYIHTQSWSTSHSWSLSVEEQFYLLWPVVLALWGVRKSLALAAIYFLTAPLIRVFVFVAFLRHAPGDLSEHFETAADALAIGCLLAGTSRFLEQSAGYKKLIRSKMFLASLLAILLAQNFIYNGTRYLFLANLLVGISLSNICIALTVHWCIVNSDAGISRVLSFSPIVTLGIISYSVYLWQEIFLSRTSPFHFPSVVILILAAGAGSYLLVERPFLKLRRLLEPVIFRDRSSSVIKTGTVAVASSE